MVKEAKKLIIMKAAGRVEDDDMHFEPQPDASADSKWADDEDYSDAKGHK